MWMSDGEATGVVKIPRECVEDLCVGAFDEWTVFGGAVHRRPSSRGVEVFLAACGGRVLREKREVGEERTRDF